MAAFYTTAAMTLTALLGPPNKDDKNGWSITFNWFDQDFAKLRIQDTRIDPAAGMAQTVRVSARLTTNLAKGLMAAMQRTLGMKVPDKTMDELKDTPAIAGRFLQSKFAPWMATVLNLGTGKDYNGQPVTAHGELAKAWVPITFLDIYKSTQELGVPAGTAAGLLAVFGMGVMTYDRKRKKKKLKYRP
jgi:hypothetical protein